PAAGRAGALPGARGLRQISAAVAGRGDRHGGGHTGDGRESLLLPAALQRRAEAPLYKPGAAVSHHSRTDRGVGGQRLESVAAGGGTRSGERPGAGAGIRAVLGRGLAPRPDRYRRRARGVADANDRGPVGAARRRPVRGGHADAATAQRPAGTARLRAGQVRAAAHVRGAAPRFARTIPAAARLRGAAAAIGALRVHGCALRPARTGGSVGRDGAVLRRDVRLVLDRGPAGPARAPVP